MGLLTLGMFGQHYVDESYLAVLRSKITVAYIYANVFML